MKADRIADSLVLGKKGVWSREPVAGMSGQV